jgi:ribose transport system permease protein
MSVDVPSDPSREERATSPDVQAVPDARREWTRKALARYGVIVVIAITFAIFSVLRPSAFFTALTIKGILRDCAPLMIASLGITFVLVMDDYDLSVGGLISLCATVVVVLMSSAYVGLNYIVAIALTLVIGVALGLLNGVLVSYLRLPAFILTIAMGTVFTGAGLQIVGSQSVYQGIPQAFINIASGTFLGFSNQVFIGVVILAIAYVALHHTEAGRYMYALGGNSEAARLSGLRVRVLRTAGFAIVGLAAAIAGILINSEAGAANPDTGVGLLLPAYAAAFLGSSMFRVGRFSALGTAVGAFYLQMIGTGLTILSLSGPVVQMIQGGILVGAIGVARMSKATDA